MSQLRQGSRRVTDGPSRERLWRQETSARPILCFREFAPRFLESGGAAMRLHTKEELHPRRAGLPGLSVILLVFYYQQDLGSSSKVSELLISGNLPCTQLRRVPSVPMSGGRSRRDRLWRQEPPCGSGVRSGSRPKGLLHHTSMSGRGWRSRVAAVRQYCRTGHREEPPPAAWYMLNALR